MTDPAYDRAVRSWAAHLRTGGTVPWRDWLDRGAGTASDTASETTSDTADILLSGPLPGAAQLELVRRLARTPGAPGPEDLAGLADRLLATSSPGRGPGEVPLVWPAGPVPEGYGVPPVDPSALDDEELLRACVGGLVALLDDVAAPPRAPRRRRLPRPWRAAFTVHGSPVAAARVRASLRGRGLVEGGGRAVHLVVAGPFDQMMAEHWVRRARRGANIGWERLWRNAATTGRVPPSIAVTDVAAQLADQSGPERVHLLVARTAEEAVALAHGALGLGMPPAPEPHPGPHLDVVSAELLRRLNGVLRLRADPLRRRELARTVLPRLVAHEGAPPLAPPKGRGRWARETGERIAADTVGAGYPVHGDPRALVPATGAGVRRTVDRGATLELGLSALARAWSLPGRTTKEG